MLQRRRSYSLSQPRSTLLPCNATGGFGYASDALFCKRLAPLSHRIFRYQAPHAGHSRPHLTRESVRCTQTKPTISVHLPSYRSPVCWGHRRNSVRAAQAQSIAMDDDEMMGREDEKRTLFPQLYPAHAAKQSEQEVLSHSPTLPLPPVPGYRSLVVVESCLLTKPHNAKSESVPCASRRYAVFAPSADVDLSVECRTSKI